MPTYHFTMPDGRKFDVPVAKGVSADEALAHLYHSPEYQNQAATKTSGVSAALHGLAHGATFGFDDELYAMTKTLAEKVFGKKVANEPGFWQEYHNYVNDARASDAQAQKDHPLLYGAGDVAGNVGTAVATGGLAGLVGKGAEAAGAVDEAANAAEAAKAAAPTMSEEEAVRRFGPYAGKKYIENQMPATAAEAPSLASKLGTAAKQGAIYGGANAAGNSDNLKDMPMAAAEGAVEGAVAAPVAGVAGKVLGSVAEAPANVATKAIKKVGGALSHSGSSKSVVGSFVKQHPWATMGMAYEGEHAIGEALGAAHHLPLLPALGAVIIGGKVGGMAMRKAGSAALGEGESKLLQPILKSKYGRILEGAAQRGVNALTATHFTLLQTDPEYRKMVEHAREQTTQ